MFMATTFMCAWLWGVQLGVKKRTIPPVALADLFDEETPLGYL